MGKKQQEQRVLLHVLMWGALLAGAILVVYCALTATGSILGIIVTVTMALVWLMALGVAVSVLHGIRRSRG